LYKGIINCQIPGDFVVVAKNNKKKNKKRDERKNQTPRSFICMGGE